MKRERSVNHGDGSSEPSPIARTAVTSADTRGFIRGESAAVNHGRNLLRIHPGPLILPIGCCCCCCCCRWWWWWWCSKRNLRDFPPVKASSLLCFSLGCWDSGENRGKKRCRVAFVFLSYFTGITTHHSHCGNKVNRQLNQQYGCVCALPSLQEWILSVAGFLCENWGWWKPRSEWYELKGGTAVTESLCWLASKDVVITSKLKVRLQ